MRLSPKQLAIMVGVAALPVLAFGLGWSQEEAPLRAIGRAAAPAEWVVPAAAERDLAADAKTLAARRPFGASVGPAATPPVPGTVADAAAKTTTVAASVQWRLGGVVVANTSRRLVVLLRPTPQSLERSELRAIGETLPDGSVIASIDPGSVAVNRDGMLVTLRMFAKN